MEPQQNKTEGLITPLNKVTPLSKYVAAFLLITLPFVGGVVGYSLEKNYDSDSNTDLNTLVISNLSEDTKTPRVVLLSENTTVDESAGQGRWDIYHSETIAVRPLVDSQEYVKFDVGSFQFLYPADGNFSEESEADFFASRFDFNQHLKFNEQTREWYIDGVERYSSTTLFRVHKLEPQEDVIAKLTALYKRTSLEEYERNVLIDLAKQFPEKDESFFLDRDFCEIKETFDGVTGYDYDVKPEYQKAVDATGEHFALFCYQPSVLKIGDVLIENLAVPMDAEEPKASNFQPVQKVDVLGY